MNEDRNAELVSVIVPVYMVEDYLDECLESIVRQTYKNLEILLIVDESSSDHSAEKCRKWCGIDDRIIYSRVKIRGLGAARNQGISEAHGEYLVFVDSDDWIRTDYVEKLYTAITKNHADMAECDSIRVKDYEKKQFLCKGSEVLGRQFDKSDRWLLGHAQMWRIMTRKELWVKHKIMQPNVFGEDVATYPLLLVYADKIVGVREGLYYYRKGRKGSLCSQTDNYEKGICMLEGVVREFKERGLYLQYRDELMVYLRRWISRMLSPLLGCVDEGAYLKARNKGIEIYGRCFAGEMLPSELLWGSFNLTRIVNKLNILEDPYSRFQFSSMIAAAIPHRQKKYIIEHKNGYRRYMLKREFADSFWSILEERKPELFFFDLLEERHDIIRTEEGFYTKSDAFEEAEVNISDYRVIPRDSEECTVLWKESCKRFMEGVLSVVSPEKIYMVENYLAERHGDGTVVENFSNIAKIQRINRILGMYYSYIRDNYPQIKCIKAYEADEYYTDNDYEYGCHPWHLNEWANIRIAEKIRGEV